MSEKITSVVVGIITIVCIVVYYCMVIYGSTKEEIPTEFLFGCSLGDEFAKLPSKVAGYEVHDGRGYKTYIPNSRHSVIVQKLPWRWKYTYEEHDGLIGCFHMQSMSMDKKEAREVMALLSKSMSDNYTSGRGLRAYKRSRNYIYNKRQGVMVEIRLEYFHGSYTVNMYYMKYSWLKRIWRSIYWNCLSFKRPWIYIGRIFIPN